MHCLPERPFRTPRLVSEDVSTSSNAMDSGKQDKSQVATNKASRISLGEIALIFDSSMLLKHDLERLLECCSLLTCFT